MREMDLGVLNSLTQYPSIETYHALNKSNGMLTDEAMAFYGDVIGTEKVDGVNARIIVFRGGGYIIGSRTELLHAEGDLVANPALGIVDAVRDIAYDLACWDRDFTVYYGEVYGHNIGKAAKQYALNGAVGFRLFDMATFSTDDLARTREQAAAWRQGGGQTFLGEEALAKAARVATVDLVPRLFTVHASDLPRDIGKVHAFLGEILPQTNVALDGGAGGKAEGIVLRSADRSAIAKARFEDYERTLRPRK